METTFFRFGSDKSRHESAFTSGFLSLFGIGLIWFVSAFTFSDNIAAVLDYAGKGLYIKILASLVFVDLLIALPLAKLRLDERPLQFALYQLFRCSV